MLLNDELKSKPETQQQLIDLWCDVFRDEEEYAALILPYLDEFDCFAEMSDGKIISAFYLLPCVINCGKKEYKGRYLYAAATHKAHRSKGIMSKLINEALEYTLLNYDFISLVPANESLYNYYSKFGFKSTMYRFRSFVKKNESTAANNSCDVLDNLDSFENIRKYFCSQGYEQGALSYAYDCYTFSNSTFCRLSETGVFCINNEQNEVIEFLSSNNKNGFDSADMLASLSADTTVYSPFSLTPDSVKEKCGMTVMFNDKIAEINNIYMNLTLG